MFILTSLVIFLFSVNKVLTCDTDACVGDTYCCAVNEINGVLVKSTPKSYNSLPSALDIASLTIEYVTSSFTSTDYQDAMQDHVVYVYHGDPSLATGLGLQTKDTQYDYVSDIYNLTTPTFDGRSRDQVYGLGGTLSGPTSILDCNVLISCTQDLYWSESILLHEFGHATQNIGLLLGDYALWNHIKSDVYSHYIANVSTASSTYCGANAQEMWACAVQIWFIGTLRTDTAPGIYTIDLMQQNVPTLYNTLFSVFGEPVKNIIYSLSDVYKMPLRPQWLYYDNYITEYGAAALKSHWQSIKHIGYNVTCDDNCDEDASSYCGSNAHVLWACGVQIWFMATSRTDTAPGIYNVDLLQSNVPLLYTALRYVFGESVEDKIESLSDVFDMAVAPDWLYYDHYVNEYGSTEIKGHWDAINGIGVTTGMASTSISVGAIDESTELTQGASDDKSCAERNNFYIIVFVVLIYTLSYA
eukprot:616187_1